MGGGGVPYVSIHELSLVFISVYWWIYMYLGGWHSFMSMCVCAFTPLYCTVGCLSIVVWTCTCAVLDVLCASVFYIVVFVLVHCS